MKKWMAMLLSLALAFALSGCAEEETVEYYVTRRCVEYDTGDVNLIEYTYDDQWHILGSKTLLNGEFASAADYSYAENFTQVTMVTTSAIYDTDTTTVHYAYDEDGKMTRSITFYEEGTPAFTTEYFYDAQGRQVRTAGIYHETDLKTGTERVYDESGNLITYMQDNGFYTARQEYTYDRQNRVTGRKNYQSDALTGYAEYTWDGNVQTGTIYRADGTPGGKSISHYDEAGNLLIEEHYDLLGTLQSRTSCEYTGTDGSISSGIAQ